MKRAAILLGMTLAASMSHASDWVEVARPKSGVTLYEYKEGSFENEEAAGNTMATAVFRVTSPKETAKFFKEKVAHSACRAGYGSLVTYSLSNVLTSNVDYAEGGGTVASSIAQFICDKAWKGAISAVIQQGATDIDYAADSAAVKRFDELYEAVKKDPVHKNRSINWIAFETHRLVVAARKTGAL